MNEAIYFGLGLATGLIIWKIYSIWNETVQEQLIKVQSQITTIAIEFLISESKIHYGAESKQATPEYWANAIKTIMINSEEEEI